MPHVGDELANPSLSGFTLNWVQTHLLPELLLRPDVALGNGMVRSSDDGSASNAGKNYSELPILHLGMAVPFVGFKNVGTIAGLPRDNGMLKAGELVGKLA